MTVKEVAELLLALCPELEGLVSCGFINKGKERAVGVYERSGSLRQCYGASSYQPKTLTLLVHWSKSSDACELEAKAIAEKLNKHDYGNGWIEVTTPPVDVGRDENEIFERTINITIYHKEA